MEEHSGQLPGQEYPHPFVHRLKMSRVERIRGIIFGSVLFPLRITLSTLLFLITWPLARLRLAGLSQEERSQPVTGWRNWLFHPIVWLLSRAVFFSLGFMWVKVKGRRANLKEAPVLVVAPHSSFLDMLVLHPTQLPTVVSRSENTNIPVIGALLEYNQSVLVSRKDPQSRRKAVQQLNERLTSNGYWPQMLMFPEGTTTNGQSLIKFKPGAFLAGVPVQPVLLRYPNKLDTVRWAYNGIAWYEVLWHTTSQLYSNMTVEFLPVYRPSEEEKKNPGLYANNVQALMAKALGIPATDYEMQGGVPVSKLGGLSLPLESPARETLSLLKKAGQQTPDMEATLKRMMDRCQAEGEKVCAEELVTLLGLKDREVAVKLCGFYSKDENVNIQQLYLSVAVISGFVTLKSLLHSAYRMFDKENRGSLEAQELSGLMEALLGVPQYNTADLYKAASPCSENDLLRVLTEHPTYQRLWNEYLQPETWSPLPCSSLANGITQNNNGNVHNGNMHESNGSVHYSKKIQ